LLLASASCAVIVTLLPAAGEPLLDVTTYFEAAAAVAVAVMSTGLPARPVDVARNVLLFVPAVVPSVQLPTVAIPLAFVVCDPLVTLPPPANAEKVTLTPATGLLFTSRTITDGGVVTAVPTVALWPVPLLTAICVAAAATVVKVALVPVFPPVVAVTVCAVPAATFVVKETVAAPLALVLVVAKANEPPPVLDHVTTWPARLTELLFASRSCAVIVTALPAAGLAALDVTR